jgi:tetratricopeptide (TPR) repeat protein/lauroyl/myristoyl acyltransferase
MNVFVLSTGRCGSTTFVAACSHIENFTSGHETRRSLLFAERLAYPDDHIESDNRLCWLLGRLDETYGDNAFYVHLVRDREATAASYNRRWHLPVGIVSAYSRAIVMGNARHGLDVCLDYWDTVNANIRLFLKDKQHCMPFALENAEEDFRGFWERIGARGDMDKAVQEWQLRFNAVGTLSPPDDREEREIRAAVETATLDPQPLRALIDLLLQSGRTNEAVQTLDDLMAAPGFSLRPAEYRVAAVQFAEAAYKILARDAFDTGRYAQARDLLVGLERLTGNEPAGAGRPSSESAERSPRANEASVTPGHPEEAYQLREQGNADLKQGRPREAIQAYRRALALEPGDPMTLNNMGIALSHHDWNEALRQFDAAYRLNPQEPRIANNLAAALLENGRLDSAVQLVARPGSPLAYAAASTVMRRYAHSPNATEVPAIRKGIDQLNQLLVALGRPQDAAEVALSIFANHLHPGIPWREQALDLSTVQEMKRWVRPRGVDRLRAVQETSRGAILVLSHLAAERVSTLVLSRMGFRLNSLEYQNRLGNHGIAGAQAVKVWEIKDTEGFTLREVYLAKQALERGEIFQLAGDGYRGGSGLPCRFLGRERHFKGGFAELAIAASVPVFPVFCTLDIEGRISLEILEPLDAGDEGTTRAERVASLIHQYATLLENCWRQQPGNVTWDHIRRYLELPAAKLPHP